MSKYKTCFALSIYVTDLAFVNPAPYNSRYYPVKLIAATEDRYSLVHCCGTGFTAIRW